MRGSLARRALIELMEKGLIKQVNFNRKRTLPLNLNTILFSAGGGSQLPDDLHQDDRGQGGGRQGGRGRRRGKFPQTISTLKADLVV